MWLSGVFAKSLRQYRVAILGWGVGMGLVLVSTMASVGTLIQTPAQRAQLTSIAAGFTWAADLVKVDTVGGYATFKIGVFIFLIGIWPILAGARTLRGEEDRGSLDTLLSLPQGRVRVALEKIAAIWVALLAMGALIGLMADAGGAKFGADFGLGGGLLLGFNLALICAVIAGCTLLVSQFTQESRTAAGIGAGLLVTFVAVDMVHRVVPNSDWLSRLSPVYYYNLNKPLVPSYPMRPLAMLGLAVLAAALSAGAVWLFARRDVGGTVPLPGLLSRSQQQPRVTRTLPSADWSLRTVYLRGLQMVAWPTFWWSLGIAGFGGWVIYLVQQMEAKLSVLYSSSPAFVSIIRSLDGADVNVNAGFMSGLFTFLPLALMAFAVTQVSGWSSDEQEGRLEMLLATPRERWTVVLGRYAALATAAVVISVLTLAITALAANGGGFRIDPGNLAAATLGMIPLALLVAGIGYLAAGWMRTAVETGLLSFVLAAWFFLSFIGPELKLPDATLRLSALYYYGQPLLHGLQLTAVAGLLAVAALTLGIGTYRFQHKDIGV